MNGTYSLVGSDDVTTVAVESKDDLRSTLVMLHRQSLDMQVPALILEHANGTALSFAQVNGGGAVLVWMANPDLSFHSKGGQKSGVSVVYSYYGQESEVPSEYVISFDLALHAAFVYLDSGIPGVPFLAWEQD